MVLRIILLLEVFLEWFRIDSHALDSIGEKLESTATFRFH